MATAPKIGGTLFEVTCEAGAQRAEHLWMVFSRLAQPPVVGVVYWCVWLATVHVIRTQGMHAGPVPASHLHLRIAAMEIYKTHRRRKSRRPCWKKIPLMLFLDENHAHAIEVEESWS